MRRALLTAAGIGAAGLLVLAGLRLLHPAVGPALQSVSRERLSESGIVTLNPFPWDMPEVTQAQAEQTAVTQAPGGKVIQSVLAEVV